MDYVSNTAAILLGVGFVLSASSIYVCWPKKNPVVKHREEPTLGDYKSINARD